jgi:hypothetical protein
MGWVGLGSKILGWVGLGFQKVTHVQLCIVDKPKNQPYGINKVAAARFSQNEGYTIIHSLYFIQCNLKLSNFNCERQYFVQEGPVMTIGCAVDCICMASFRPYSECDRH